MLPGGLRIVTESIPGAQSATIGIWVGVGSRDETPAQAGSAHYLEHLLFKGTRRRTAMQIAAEVDAIGGDINAFTARESTCFYVNVLGSDLPLATDIISDVVLGATMRSADVENERLVVLEEIAMRDDDPADLAGELFYEVVFGTTPLARSILGDVERIESITRSQIVSFYKKHYRPDNMVVSVAGQVDHRAVVSAIRRIFAAAVDPEAGPVPVRRGDRRRARPADRTVRVARRRSEQAHVVLGMRAFDRFDDRRFALAILEAALGGGMSSRLFQEIRENRGLAYSVYAYSALFAGDGLFGVYAGCAPTKVRQVIGIIRDQLADVAAHGLSDEEITRAIGQVRGSLVLGLEDTGSRMIRLGQSEVLYGEHVDVPWLIDRFSSVTADQVSSLAADLLTRQQCLAVVGPFKGTEFDRVMAG